ncbi:MAG: ABC transporter permease [Staphylothermus sp.]|nr:ABC transporter permease [Staphylothermus sp.]
MNTKNNKNVTFLDKLITWIKTSDLAKPIIPVIGLYIIASLLAPQYFLSPYNQKIILMQVTPLLAIATGEMLIILMGSIDLTPGSSQGVTAMLAALVYITTGNFGLAILSAILLGMLIGSINGILVTKLKIFSFVATLAGLVIWRAVDLWISGGRLIYGLKPFGIFSEAIGVVPIGFIIMVLINIAVYLLLKHTAYGRYVYAIGGNEEAVRMAGVRVDLIKFISFMLAGLMYGIGGVMIIGMSGLAVDPWTAYGYELNAIATCVLGGILLIGGAGHPLGVIFGAFLLTLLMNLLVLLGLTQASIQQIVTGFVLIAAATTLARGLKYVK